MSLHNFIEGSETSSQCQLHDCHFGDPHPHLRRPVSPPLLSTTDLLENQKTVSLHPMRRNSASLSSLGDCAIYSSPEPSITKSISRSQHALIPDESSKASCSQSPKTPSPKQNTDPVSHKLETSQLAPGFNRHLDSHKPDPEIERLVDPLRLSPYQPSLMTGGAVDLLRTFTPTPRGTFSFGSHPRRQSAPMSFCTNQEASQSNVTKTMHVWRGNSLGIVKCTSKDRITDWVGDQTRISTGSPTLSVYSPKPKDSTTPKALTKPPPEAFAMMPPTINDGIIEMGLHILPKHINNSNFENREPSVSHSAPPWTDILPPMAVNLIELPPRASSVTILDGAMDDTRRGIINPQGPENGDIDHGGIRLYHQALQDIYFLQVERMLRENCGISRCREETHHH